jgi:hypothetical protein
MLKLSSSPLLSGIHAVVKPSRWIRPIYVNIIEHNDNDCKGLNKNYPFRAGKTLQLSAYQAREQGGGGREQGTALKD